jgi:uncharacterized membrane protein YdcZ (DUF606 family)
VAVINRQGLILTLAAGALGILIIMGVSFSIQRAGMAAGMAAVILGQFLFGVVADTTGLGGLAPIPLDFRRIAGLVGLAISVYLLLPKK